MEAPTSNNAVTLPPGFTLAQSGPRVPEGFTLEKSDSGLLPTLGALARGAAAGALGTAGDIEGIVQAPFDALQTAVQGKPHTQSTLLAGTKDFEKTLPGGAAATAHPTAQAIGTLLPDLAGGAATALKLAKGAPAVVSRILPGATRRAEEAIKDIGPSLDKDTIGRSVLSSLRPDYDALHATRGQELARVAQMPDGPERTAAFRAVYNDQKYAELKKFEDSPLGQKVISDTTKYSNVPRINPKNFLDQAFRTPQDVRDLRKLFDGNQGAVESVAKRYAASELKGIMDTAKAGSATEANPFKSEAGSIATQLIRWRAQNSDWLKQVPETKKAVDDFVDNMFAVARTQKHFKYAVSAGATLGLFAEGHSPFSWLSRLFGGVE